jgi:UDP-4-amino-4,6-dideoxy-N-acetyl-beta-L-altrosamine N-acetyltransferase
VSKSKPEKGLIRKMTVKDIDQVLQWRNHIDVRRFMFTQEKITLDEHRNWFERVSQDSRRHLLVFEDDGIPSGSVNFNQLDIISIADWGFYLATDAKKGVGRQMGLAALDYAFEELDLRKVCGKALAFNDRSIQFHLNLGFKQEGVLREQHFDGQKFYDVVCFGLLAAEWNQYNREGLWHTLA